MDNESWVIEAGGRVISKTVVRGNDDVPPIEQLVYCLWVADYGMRNAGDLDTALAALLLRRGIDKVLPWGKQM